MLCLYTRDGRVVFVNVQHATESRLPTTAAARDAAYRVLHARMNEICEMGSRGGVMARDGFIQVEPTAFDKAVKAFGPLVIECVAKHGHSEFIDHEHTNETYVVAYREDGRCFLREY